MKKSTYKLLAVTLAVIMLLGVGMTFKTGGLDWIPGIDKADDGDGNGDGNGNGNLGPYGTSVPIEFVLLDQYQGGAIGSATIDFYEHGEDLKIQTLTTDGTTGKVTSSYNYASGDAFDISVVKGDSKYWFSNVILPYYDTETKASSLTKHSVPLAGWTLGTYSLTAALSDGTSIADAGDLNKTITGNTPTLKFTLYNSVDNSGYKSSYDLVEKYADEALALVKITGTNGIDVIVKSPTWPYKEKGTDRYYGGALPDSQLTRIVASDGSTTQEGSYTWSVNLDLTSYVGDAADLVVSVNAYTCWEAFNYYGAVGADSVQLATITINLVD